MENHKLTNKKMKIAINKCHGGFGLSPKAMKMYASLKGKDCYFFDHDFRAEKYIPITLQEAENSTFFICYSVPNPQDYRLNEPDADGLYKSANERASKISLDTRPGDRSDPHLIEVIEKLGDNASGRYGHLKIVEIPDGIEWEIEEYDGMEWIAEKHRTWR